MSIADLLTKPSYTEVYEAALEAQMNRLCPIGRAICVKWHGEKFGHPGWGGVDWVAGQIDKALAAVEVMESFKNE